MSSYSVHRVWRIELLPRLDSSAVRPPTRGSRCRQHLRFPPSARPARGRAGCFPVTGGRSSKQVVARLDEDGKRASRTGGEVGDPRIAIDLGNGVHGTPFVSTGLMAAFGLPERMGDALEIQFWLPLPFHRSGSCLCWIRDGHQGPPSMLWTSWIRTCSVPFVSRRGKSSAADSVAA